MFVGFFIIGFIAGYIVSMTGGLTLAKRSESQAIQRGTKAVEHFKASRSMPPSGEQDYHASVPSSWRD